MTGSPPVQATVAAVAMALISLPLIKLTSDPSALASSQMSPSSAPSPSAQTSVAVPTLVRVQASHLPTQLTISLDGKRLLAMSPSDSAVTASPSSAASTSAFYQEMTLPLQLPTSGIDLLVHGEWLPGTPDAAVSITLAPEGLEEQRHTLWSTGALLDDVTTFIWPGK